MRNVLSLLLFFVLLSIEAQQSYPITFTHAGKTVFGTFTTPDGPGPFPTIIINPGSGPNDRDGTFLLSGGNVPCLYPELEGETVKPYKELSDALVDSGYAVLRYDKLEFTYPNTLGTITFHKLWLPVESAIEYVKTRSDVDTSCLTLIGHSEGSSLIPFIALDRTDIKTLISIAGARTPFDSILAYQLVHFAELCNGDTITAQQQASQILDYFYDVRNGNCLLLPPAFGVPACAWKDYFEATDPVAENYNLNNLPSLFIGLGLDINVPPAELIRFQNEVTITDDFWSIPGLNHYMTPNDDPHVSEVLTDTIVYWLRQQCMGTSISDPTSTDDHKYLLSPNPFQNSVTIHFPVAPQQYSVSVFDPMGRKVLYNYMANASHLDSATIDLSNLPAGYYFIQVVADNQVGAVRIIKF